MRETGIPAEEEYRPFPRDLVVLELSTWEHETILAGVALRAEFGYPTHEAFVALCTAGRTGIVGCAWDVEGLLLYVLLDRRPRPDGPYSIRVGATRPSRQGGRGPDEIETRVAVFADKRFN